tara:strand:- start:440 stop:592 length:153 start_codon:yes stop_codon:yes gene_type:complete
MPTIETPMGVLTVITVDDPSKGRKAGTTTMEYYDPPPVPMKLKKKYRQSS